MDSTYGHGLVAGEVHDGVLEHGAVASGEDEPVAVSPLGVGGVVLHGLVVEHVSHGSATHGAAGVAGVGLVHTIDGEEPAKRRLLDGGSEPCVRAVAPLSARGTGIKHDRVDAVGHRSPTRRVSRGFPSPWKSIKQSPDGVDAVLHGVGLDAVDGVGLDRGDGVLGTLAVGHHAAGGGLGREAHRRGSGSSVEGKHLCYLPRGPKKLLGEDSNAMARGAQEPPGSARGRSKWPPCLSAVSLLVQGASLTGGGCCRGGFPPPGRGEGPRAASLVPRLSRPS